MLPVNSLELHLSVALRAAALCCLEHSLIHNIYEYQLRSVVRGCRDHRVWSIALMGRAMAL